MKKVKIEPTDEYKVPYDDADQEPADFYDALHVATNTAELLDQLGAVPEVPRSLSEHRKLLKETLENRETRNLDDLPVALGAASFLRTYGQQLAMDVAQIRAALTNKLLELADHTDPKYALKAIELLGKHSDVSLFTERSEVTINYKDSSELETAIKNRIKRLMNAEIIDAAPILTAIDTKLGIIDGEFTEVEESKDEKEEHSGK